MEKFKITLDGVTHEVEVEKVGASSARQVSTPTAAAVAVSSTPVLKASAPVKKAIAVPAGAKPIKAPMPGKILSVSATVGQVVKSGDVLAILEAMKMANEIMAPTDGKVIEINATVGQAVSTGDVLIVME
ncbi:MAG: biotin/lipoyl-containing protein [Selenomonadaceae bacterium]